MSTDERSTTIRLCTSFSSFGNCCQFPRPNSFNKDSSGLHMYRSSVAVIPHRDLHLRLPVVLHRRAGLLAAGVAVVLHRRLPAVVVPHRPRRLLSADVLFAFVLVLGLGRRFGKRPLQLPSTIAGAK